MASSDGGRNSNNTDDYDDSSNLPLDPERITDALSSYTEYQKGRRTPGIGIGGGGGGRNNININNNNIMNQMRKNIGATRRMRRRGWSEREESIEDLLASLNIEGSEDDDKDTEKDKEEKEEKEEEAKKEKRIRSNMMADDVTGVNPNDDDGNDDDDDEPILSEEDRKFIKHLMSITRSSSARPMQAVLQDHLTWELKVVIDVGTYVSRMLGWDLRQLGPKSGVTSEIIISRFDRLMALAPFLKYLDKFTETFNMMSRRLIDYELLSKSLIQLFPIECPRCAYSISLEKDLFFKLNMILYINNMKLQQDMAEYMNAPFAPANNNNSSSSNSNSNSNNNSVGSGGFPTGSNEG